jgi:hypothetical protein
MIVAVIAWFKDFFSGAHVTQELEQYIKSRNPSTPEEIERIEREFWRRKTQGRYF